MVMESTARKKKGEKRGKRGSRAVPNERQFELARLIVAGRPIGEAYAEVYKPTSTNANTIAKHATARSSTPAVLEAIARLRRKAERYVLLSLNDRLKTLSVMIQDEDLKTTDRIYATATYSRISGDQAPERHQVEAAVAVSVSSAPLIRTLSARERLDSMREARRRSLAIENAPKIVLPEAPPAAPAGEAPAQTTAA